MTDTDCGTAAVVLVAEDETLVRLLANDILTEAGYRVLEARDGQEALTILEVHGDVRGLVTDVSMPNVDGISLEDRSGALAPYRHRRRIRSHARGEPGCHPEYARFVPKPYSPDRLVGALKAAMAETADFAPGPAPIALTSIPNLHAGRMHGAGGLAQPLPEPEE